VPNVSFKVKPYGIQNVVWLADDRTSRPTIVIGHGNTVCTANFETTFFSTLAASSKLADRTLLFLLQLQIISETFTDTIDDSSRKFCTFLVINLRALQQKSEALPRIRD